MIIWQICPPRLSAVASLLWENPKKSSSAVLFVHVSGYLCYLRRKQTVTLLPAPPENVTMLTCEIQKLFHLTKDLLRSFKCWWLSKELVVGWRYWLWKDPFVEYQACNVTASVQSDHLLHGYLLPVFTPLISRIMHHALLKFSPCRNKPLPQLVCIVAWYLIRVLRL